MGQMARKQPMRDDGPGPIAALLTSQKASAQEHRIQELLQVISSPISEHKQRLAALAKIEQHLASTVLSGDPRKQAAWWALQRSQGCSVASMLVPHLHTLLLHLAMAGTTSTSASSSRSAVGRLSLTLGSQGDAELLAEELVTCLSILQGLAVCDRTSREACSARTSLEILLLVLNAHHLAGEDLIAPACHALDLLMCVLVDASDELSELFETLGGIDQISAVWKARAEVVAMRKAAARVEREAARMRGIDYFHDHRKVKNGKGRPASEDAINSSPQKQKRRAHSDYDNARRPVTPPAQAEPGNGRRTPNTRIRSPIAPASPITPVIPQRNSSSNDAEASGILSSPSSPQQKQRLLASPTPRAARVARGPASDEEPFAIGRPRGLVQTRSSGDDGDSSSSNSDRCNRPSSTGTDRPLSSNSERRMEKMRQIESEGEDEPDELCEKCIEFLIFYLQPELLEKEAKREQRRRAKLLSDPALQLGASRMPAQDPTPRVSKARADRRPPRAGAAKTEGVAAQDEDLASISEPKKNRESPTKPLRKQAMRRV